MVPKLLTLAPNAESTCEVTCWTTTLDTNTVLLVVDYVAIARDGEGDVTANLESRSSSSVQPPVGAERAQSIG